MILFKKLNNYYEKIMGFIFSYVNYQPYFDSQHQKNQSMHHGFQINLQIDGILNESF